MPLLPNAQIWKNATERRNKERSSVTLGEEDRQRMFDQLLRSIGTLNAQSLNRFQDTATAQGLPAATRLAQERGIAIGGAQAAEQGAFDIDQFIASTNIEGEKFLLQLEEARRARKAAEEASKWQSLMQAFGGIGGGIGYALGGKL